MTDKISEFINNNFELLLWLNIAWLLFFVVMLVLLKIQDIAGDRPRTLIPKVLLIFVVMGQIALVLLSGYIYWFNYQRKSVATFSQRLIPGTHWVKEDLMVYFISGRDLISIHANGSNKQKIFQSPDKIREYHFSPDGQYLLVVTERELYQVNLATLHRELIDFIPIADPGKQLSGVIGRISWSPDSQRFCYEITKWSNVSSYNQFYIYHVQNKQKQPLRKLTKKISYLFWDKKATSLYFFQQEAMDTSRYPYPYKIKIYKIPLSTLTAEMVAEVLTKKAEISRLEVTGRGINLFWKGNNFSFNRSGQRDYDWVSETGARLGIDEDDFLYYIKNRWWRKRLFRVPRDPLPGDFNRYQFSGGMLSVGHLRWLPGGRYVIMGHSTMGILILEPSTGKIGRLTDTPGYTFGWYQELKTQN